MIQSGINETPIMPSLGETRDLWSIHFLEGVGVGVGGPEEFGGGSLAFCLPKTGGSV